MVARIALALWIFCSPAFAWTHGSSTANTAPIGFGLGGLTINVDQPFLNLMHAGQYWGATSGSIAITGVGAGAVDAASGTGSVTGTALTITTVSTGTYRKNQTVTGTGITGSSVITSGGDCSHGNEPCSFTLSQSSSATGSIAVAGSGHLVRISLASNAPVVEATVTASISTDPELGNLTTATGVTVSGNVMTVPNTNIMGTFATTSGTTCGANGCIVTGAGFPANTVINTDGSTTNTACGGVQCTGNRVDRSGTFALNNSFTVASGVTVTASNTLTPVLHVTAVSSGHIQQGAYVSAPATNGTTINISYTALTGTTGNYSLCDAFTCGTPAAQTQSSQTFLISSIRPNVSGVTGPTEANGCGSIIPVNDGASFDCVGLDYSGTTWGGAGSISIRYGEYNYAFNLDANGYPQSMTGSGMAAGITMTEYDLGSLNPSSGINSNGYDNTTQTGPFYSAGNYLVQYTGGSGGCGGTVTYGGDAACSSTVSQGTDVINVATATGSGISVQINNITGGYVHGMSMVYCGTYSATAYLPSHCSTGYDTLLANGENFNPVFVAKLKAGGTTRFMDWLQANNTAQVNFTQRPTLTQLFWHGIWSVNQTDPMPNGTPIEAMIQLANEAGMDPWFNMPLLATDAYVTSFANLVHSNLNSNLRAYVEWDNEIWNVCNGANPTYRPGLATSIAAFPNAANVCGGFREYFESLRATQARSLWKTAWGADANRVFGVMAGQGGGDGICSFGPLNCVLLQLAPGADGSNIATQWTAYGLRTDSGSSTSASITGTVMTAGGTTSGFKVGQFLTGNNVTSPTTIAFDANNTTPTSCGGSPCTGNTGNGTYGLTASSTASATSITGVAGASTNIDIFAVGKYLQPCGPVSSYDGFTNDQYFTQMNTGGLGCTGGSLATTVAEGQLDYNTVHAFGLPIVAYEIGQQFIAGGDTSAAQVFANGTRDARMGTTFQSLFGQLKSIGFDVMNYYVLTGQATHFGDFIGLENINQTTTPTYGGILTFNAANPCWWGSQAPWASAGGCR